MSTSVTSITEKDLRVTEKGIFHKDKTRGKFLLAETISFKFTGSGNVDGEYLEYSGTMADGNGFRCPWPCTIVQIKGHGGANPSKSFDIDVNGEWEVLDVTFSDGEYDNDAHNHDLEYDDLVEVYGNSAGPASNNPEIEIILRRRIEEESEEEPEEEE